MSNWRDKNWRVNCYQCKFCRTRTTTVDVDEGVTPFILTCPKCGGPATSSLYPEARPIPALIPDITLEWYKPDEPVLAKDDPQYEKELAHIQQGGLLSRERTDAEPVSHKEE